MSELKRNQAAEDLRSILRTAEGRRFLYGLVESLGLTAPVQGDLARGEGQRDAAIFIMTQCQKADAGLWIQAYIEAAQARQQEAFEQERDAKRAAE